jgi:hypothetical protein
MWGTKAMSRSKGISKGEVAVGSNITYLTGTPVKDPSDICDEGGLVAETACVCTWISNACA